MKVITDDRWPGPGECTQWEENFYNFWTKLQREKFITELILSGFPGLESTPQEQTSERLLCSVCGKNSVFLGSQGYMDKCSDCIITEIREQDFLPALKTVKETTMCPHCQGEAICWKQTPTQRHMYCKVCGKHWLEPVENKEA